MKETLGTVKMKGNPLELDGVKIKAGDKAPAFTAVCNDLSAFKFEPGDGTIYLLSSVPSLDTPVCDTETRKFNEKAEQFGDNVKVITVSMDLPFAQAKWCGNAGIENVETVSDHRDVSFGTNYGVLIKDLRLLARALFVVDGQGTVQYVQLVDEVTDEPRYDEVISAVKESASRPAART